MNQTFGGQTHTDVRPALLGYDDLFEQFRTYATAVKGIDPTAQITGPVSWGWTNYLYSPLDAGSDKYQTHADRKRHKDVPFLLWFLQQARAQELQTKKRLLDVLDVHYYPQCDVYNQKIDADTAARRIRSVRSLYDAQYRDESWIGEPVRLIPRLQEWINSGYPGTKIGITEWNFGGDTHMSGAIAIAEVLGIFGRNGVYMASYWTTPPKDSPGYLAFRLLSNPAGNGRRGVEDVSCLATSGDDARLAVFAATDEEQQIVSLLLINKMPKATMTVPITLAASAKWGAIGGTGYQLTADATGTKAKHHAV